LGESFLELGASNKEKRKEGIDMTITEMVDAMNQKFDNSFSLDKPGRKYTRLVHSVGSSRSVHCFIDKAGNIYKAASWKAPAKGVRGTLASFDINKVDQFTGWLYR
jgi:hypothetical protein